MFIYHDCLRLVLSIGAQLVAVRTECHYVICVEGIILDVSISLNPIVYHYSVLVEEFHR